MVWEGIVYGQKFSSEGILVDSAKTTKNRVNCSDFNMAVI